MPQFITDNIFSIIAILTTITIAITTYLKNKKRKELSYTVLSSTSLLIKDEGLNNRIKITVDGAEVKDEIYLILLKLINTGNVPIKPDDFIEDLTIESNGSIIVAEVKETNPPNLTVKIDNAIGDVFGITTVERLLLNPKDEITLKLLATKNQVSLKSRIVGVEKIAKLKKRFPLIPILLCICSIAVFLVLGNFEKDKNMFTFYGLSAALLTAMTASATLLAIFETWKERKN